MPRIVLKPKYKALAKQNVVVDVKAGSKIKMRRPAKKNMNIKKLAYQVAKINCEKKESNLYAPSQVVGQFYAVSAGSNPSSAHYLSNFITALPSNGNTDTTRIGDEYSITGMRNIFQFSHQANTSQTIRGRIMLIAPRLGVSGSSVTIDKILQPNPVAYYGNGALFPIYDYTCSRNVDYLKDFKVIRTKKFVMPGDTASLSQKVVKTVDFNLKFKKKPWIVRYDSSGAISFGQMWLLILVESGNTSSNVPSTNTVGIPVTDTVSGLNFQYYSKTYFIDP